MKYGIIKNYSNGKNITEGEDLLDIYSPVNNELIGKVNISKQEDLNLIVNEAIIAQEKWKKLTLKARSEVLYNYRNLLIQYKDELAIINHEENGKSMEEAHAGIGKAIELTEFACSIPQLAEGKIEQVSRGVYCQTTRKPLGIVGCITPLNFPVMVPHWTVPNAIALGNAVILKPSEKTPISAAFSAKLWKEAGLPDGIYNIYNGGKDAVNALCDHKDIKAITFVGSTPVAKKVYQRATSNFKRVLALGGAKNFLVIAPDAHEIGTANDVVASATGMSGQRCMAASVLVLIDKSEHILDLIIKKFKEQRPGVDIPPLIDSTAVENIHNYIEKAKKLGARILVDGREHTTSNPCIIGSTIIDWRNNEDKLIHEEIFGPVLEILGTATVNDALKLQKKSPYGNASSIFTQNGRVAQEFLAEANAGMIGVNIGVPVPREPFSFGGVKLSKFGAGDITGKSSIDFWTDLIKITSKWNPEDKQDWMS